jgi:hypothetical protein
VDIAQQRAEDEPCQLQQGRIFLKRQGKAPSQLGSDLDEIQLEVADSSHDSIPNLNFVNLKADMDMDCSVSKKMWTQDDTDSPIDGSASDESAPAECSCGCQSWVAMGVDVSSGDDPFHADWPFWK